MKENVSHSLDSTVVPTNLKEASRLVNILFQNRTNEVNKLELPSGIVIIDYDMGQIGLGIVRIASRLSNPKLNQYTPIQILFPNGDQDPTLYILNDYLEVDEISQGIGEYFGETLL